MFAFFEPSRGEIEANRPVGAAVGDGLDVRLELLELRMRREAVDLRTVGERTVGAFRLEELLQ